MKTNHPPNISTQSDWKDRLESFDKRRDILIAGDKEQMAQFCVDQFLSIAREAISERGLFTAALSGGQTPLAIFKELSRRSKLAAESGKDLVDWRTVHLFWSDERSVPIDSSENNYTQAMQAGLAHLPIPPENIHRMVAEDSIEENAKNYEALIRKEVPSLHFDLIMLGMGEDGHTASLFPRTHALHSNDRLVVANYVPQKHTWRMTFTYECIHMARYICLYITGANKASVVDQALVGPYDPDNLPVQKIGTASHKAIWILDKEASLALMKSYTETN